MSRQQAFDPSCATAFAACLLLLEKLDTTSQRWHVLPDTQGAECYRCVCLLCAAQRPTQGSVGRLFLLSRTCCFQRHLARATSTFCPAKPVQGRSCWLTCYAQSHRHACVKLRLAALSERADITNPTKTYGPHCSYALIPDPGCTGDAVHGSRDHKGRMR